MFIVIVVVVVVAPNWKSSKAHQQMSELTNYGVATEYNIVTYSREWTLNMCSVMDEFQNNYANWK